MGLSHITIPRKTVDMDDGQKFEVRAISTNDLIGLVATHGPGLAMIFGKIKSGELGQDLTADAVRDGIFELAQGFPDIAATIIAIAADGYTDEEMEVARRLPLPAQADAIEKIFGLTFSSEATVKKLLESLTRMMLGVSETLATAPNLANGIGASAAA